MRRDVRGDSEVDVDCSDLRPDMKECVRCCALLAHPAIIGMEILVTHCLAVVISSYGRRPY